MKTLKPEKAGIMRSNLNTRKELSFRRTVRKKLGKGEGIRSLDFLLKRMLKWAI